VIASISPSVAVVRLALNFANVIDLATSFVTIVEPAAVIGPVSVEPSTNFATVIRQGYFAITKAYCR